MILDVVFVILALGLLWKGSDWLVESSVALASRLGIPQLIIGLTVVALGTSAPEFVVTIGAAMKGQEAISISNVIGSNIFNLGFIMGGVALFSAIEIPDKLVRRDGVIMTLMTLGLFLILLDGRFGRIEGVLLFAGFIGYLTLLFFEKREVDLELSYKNSALMDTGILIGGMAMVVIGGSLLREGAVGIARAAGLSEWVIGATVVAIGTSAPEFAASMVAGIKGHHGVSVGNLVGSCIFNGLGVLGVAGMLRPMAVSPVAWQSTGLLLVLVVVAVILLKTQKRLTRIEGGVLVLLSLAIYVVQLRLELH